MKKSKEVTVVMNQSDVEELLRRGVKLSCEKPCCMATKRPLYTFTRLDNRYLWTDANLETHRLEDMDTSYLINVHRMLISRPSTVVSFMIGDINRVIRSVGSTNYPVETLRNQIYEVTSLSLTDLDYLVRKSPFFISLIRELKSRAVNVGNLEFFYTGDCHE